MVKWAISTAMLVVVSSASSASPATLLALGEKTPSSACRDRNDCGFKRGPVSYVSFEGLVTRREVCAPAPILFNVARKGDRLEAVRLRLHNSGWIYIKANRDGDDRFLSAVSKTDEFKSVTVTFDGRGYVKCVTEMLTSI